MICPQCRREFERTAPRQAYCSPDCQWKHHLAKKNAARRAERAARAERQAKKDAAAAAAAAQVAEEA